MPAKRHKLTFVNEPRSWLLDKITLFQNQKPIKQVPKKKKKPTTTTTTIID